MNDVVKRLKNNVVCLLVFFFFKYDRSVFLDCVLWINLIVDFFLLFSEMSPERCGLQKEKTSSKQNDALKPRSATH